MNPDWLEQIDQIFQSALDLPSEQRADFLASQCGKDSELRAEIESLLSAHENSGSFIDNSAADMAAALFERQPPLFSRIGQYKIERLLGRGGMGEVYLAIDKIGRRVALKTLSSRVADDQQHIARFLQEARSVVAMNHPNIVTVYDIGQAEGTYYIASELIEGESLRERLNRERLPLSDALEIAIQIASALSAAHEKGIIHRDIKPENVMIRRDGYVKVLDFGIAKLTDQFAGPISTDAPTRPQCETAEGLLIGTASHMSPEQARGIKVDERTDIWSAGVVIYEMNTGQQPFAAATAAEMIARILERDPAQLSTYMNDVPDELQVIINSCLAKNRDQRYQTAKDLLTALRNFKEEQEFVSKLKHSSEVQTVQSQTARESSIITDERPVSSAEFIVKGAKRHKVALLFTATTFILLAAVLSYWSFKEHRSSGGQIETLAVLPFVNESGSPDLDYLSDGLSESLINSLSRLPNLAVKARSSVFRYKGKEIDPQQAASELSVQAIINGRVIQRGDDLSLNVELVDARNGNQIWGDQYNRKLVDLAVLENQITNDISEKLRGQMTASQQKTLAKSSTDNSEAYQLYLKGRYHVLKLTLSEVQTGISYFQQAIAVDPTYALAYVGLADAYRSSLVGDMPPNEVLQKAKDAAQKAIKIDDTLAEAHAELGFIIFWHDWDWNAAESENKRALALDPNNEDAHLFYAHLLSNLGRHSEALQEVKRARELDPMNLRTAALEGQFLIHAGRPDDSLARLQKTFEMAPDYYFAHLFAASAYIEKRMYGEAITEAEKARQFSGPTNSHPVGFLGFALAKLGKQQQARALLDELLKASTERYVSPYNIALIYNGLDERDEALKWLEKAYELRDQRIVFLKVEPKWNNLRNEPRFKDLLNRLRLD
jgi:serine/threonine-protein kinase